MTRSLSAHPVDGCTPEVTPNPLPQRRVLYVEKASGFGGSIVSLYRLATNLDRRRFVPVVLFYRPNHYVEQFEAEGIHVVVVDNVMGDPTLITSINQESKIRAAARGFIPAPVLMAYRSSKLYYNLVYKTLPLAWRLQHIIKDLRIDLVHLNDLAVRNREALIASKLAGIPCVCHVRQYGEANHLDRFLARHVHFTIYISDAMKRFWESKLPVRRSRVVYDGLSLDNYLTAGNGQDVRTELGLDADDFVLASVGRIVEWKGHEVLLRALALAKRTVPNLKCAIVGEPDPPDNLQYLTYLRELARELQLADAALFLGFRRDIPHLLSSIDVLVHSATEPEPFGLTVIEGMAAGKPAIGTRAGGVPEIIEDGATGLLVPPGDVEGLASAITSLALDRDKAEKMGDKARRDVQTRFSTAKFLDDVQDVYDQVLYPQHRSTPQRIH